MNYILTPNRLRRTVNVTIQVSESSGTNSIFKLSKWRPGRYELGDYDRKVHGFKAFSTDNKPLKLMQLDSHSWEVYHAKDESFSISYDFYANQPDAGGSYITDDCFYINGINCLLYQDSTIDNPCTLRLALDTEVLIACGASFVDNSASFSSFHELADHPFIASNGLQHHQFSLNDHSIHLWFYGNCKPDYFQIEQDFFAFSKAQIALFGEYPEEAYHYLFLIHDEFAYHGVEHRNSTVITLGPGSKLMGSVYNELLGVSSHEFFHAWNVKSIRPQDMLPYEYGRATNSVMHYVTEGITTYYGDLMLLRSGVWNLDQYLKNFNQALLGRHYGTDGQRYISLENASFNSWSGAYSPGIPNRKISFYTKGALVAFLLDVYIRNHSEGEHSLDSLMQTFYQKFGGHKSGYTSIDFVNTVTSLTGGKDFSPFYEKFYQGLESLDTALLNAAEFLGLSLKREGWADPLKQWLGIGVKQEGSGLKVLEVFENSPGEVAGFHRGDEIIAIGNIKVNKTNHPEEATFALKEKMTAIHYFRKGRLMEVAIEKAIEPYGLLQFKESNEILESARLAYDSWAKA